MRRGWCSRCKTPVIAREMPQAHPREDRDGLGWIVTFRKRPDQPAARARTSLRCFMILRDHRVVGRDLVVVRHMAEAGRQVFGVTEAPNFQPGEVGGRSRRQQGEYHQGHGPGEGTQVGKPGFEARCPTCVICCCVSASHHQSLRSNWSWWLRLRADPL
jgi:hypothetical protein